MPDLGTESAVVPAALPADPRTESIVWPAGTYRQPAGVAPCMMAPTPSHTDLHIEQVVWPTAGYRQPPGLAARVDSELRTSGAQTEWPVAPVAAQAKYRTEQIVWPTAGYRQPVELAARVDSGLRTSGVQSESAAPAASQAGYRTERVVWPIAGHRHPAGISARVDSGLRASGAQTESPAAPVESQADLRTESVIFKPSAVRLPHRPPFTDARQLHAMPFLAGHAPRASAGTERSRIESSAWTAPAGLLPQPVRTGVPALQNAEFGNERTTAVAGVAAVRTTRCGWERSCVQPAHMVSRPGRLRAASFQLPAGPKMERGESPAMAKMGWEMLVAPAPATHPHRTAIAKPLPRPARAPHSLSVPPPDATAIVWDDAAAAPWTPALPLNRERCCLDLLWPVFPHPKRPRAPLAILESDSRVVVSPAAFPLAELPPGDAGPFDDANHLFQQGRFEEALALYANAAEVETLRGRAAWYSALCLQNLGRWEHARKQYLIALALGVAVFEVKVGLALCNLHCGRAHSAFRELRQFLKVEPQSFMTLFGAAAALQLIGRAHDAAEVYRHILALYPGSQDARMNLRQIEGNRMTVAGAIESAPQELVRRTS
jgi:hypothetical protein